MVWAVRIEADREDFERRLLALLRRIDDPRPLEAWQTGQRRRAGFHSPLISMSSMTGNLSSDEAMLREALEVVRREREHHSRDSDDVEDDDDSDAPGEIDVD